MKQIYSKCSIDRDPRFAIITDIYKAGNDYSIIKKPYEKEATEHLYHMISVCERANEIYKESSFSYARVWKCEKGIEIEFLKGKNLEDIADEYLLCNQPQKAVALMDKVISWILSFSHEVSMEKIPYEFNLVFGNHFDKKQFIAADVGNIDLILSNLIALENGYKVIDYEWTFDFDIPAHYIIYRLLFSYLESNQLRASLKEYGLYQRYGISADDINIYQKMEENFQMFVRGKTNIKSNYENLGESQKCLINSVYQEENQADYDIAFLNTIQNIRQSIQDGEYLQNIINATEYYRFSSLRLKNAYNLDISSNAYNIKIYFSDKDLKKYGRTVTLVSHELNRTGAPVVLQDLARILLEKKYNVLIVSPVDGPLREEYIAMGCTVIIQHNLMKGQYTNEVISDDKLWLLNDLVRKSSFTVFCTLVLHNLVCHYIDTNYPIYWWLHEGDITFKDCKEYLPQKISSNIHILAGGQYVLDRFKKYNISGYTGQILSYMVEDVTMYQPKKHDNTIVRFVCAGTIDYRKGQDLLVEAIKLLPYHYLKQIDVTFIGARNYDYIVKKIESLTRCYENVHLLGTMSRTELYQEYEKADCIISPSRDDPMPVVLTENMRIGNICVCSTSTGTSAYIENGVNGFVFESEKVENLANQIMYIVDHKEYLNTIGENSRKIYDENFSRRIFVENIEKLLLQGLD